MNWWQQALITFGAKSEDSSDTWTCLICKDTFNTEKDIQTHLNGHNFEDFKALKFEVTVKGLKGNDWDTISQNTINVAIDCNPKAEENVVITENNENREVNQDCNPKAEENVVITENNENREVNQGNEPVLDLNDSTPFTRRLSDVRKRLSMEDPSSEMQTRKKAKQIDNAKNTHGENANSVMTKESESSVFVPRKSQRLSKSSENVPSTSNDEEMNTDTVHVLIENRDVENTTPNAADKLSQNKVLPEETISQNASNHENVSLEYSPNDTKLNMPKDTYASCVVKEELPDHINETQEIENEGKMKTQSTPNKNIKTFVKKMKSNKGKGPVYTCDACEYEAESHMLYHKHIITHIEDKPIVCWYCETQFENNFVTAGKPLKGKRKQAKRKRKKTLREIDNDHSSDIVALDYTCFLCSYSFENNTALDQHLQCVHPDEIANKTKEEIETLKSSTKPGETAEIISAVAFYCHICHWKSDRHFNYHRHVLSHTIGKSFKCIYCSKIINTNNSKTGYGQIQHECPECQKEFHSKFKLSLHRYEIHGKKSAGSMQCNICGFIGRTKKSIEKHHILDHGDEKFSLDDINIIQKEVIKVRKDPRQYTCEKCGFSAGRKDTMEKHSLTHIPETQRYLYCCMYCEYQTYARSSLNMHVARKHRFMDASELTTILKCDLCKKFTCTDKTTLLEHRNDCTSDPSLEDSGDGMKHKVGVVKKELNKSGGNNDTGLTGKDPKVLLDAVMTPELGDTSGFFKQTSATKCSIKKKIVYICHECDLTFDRKWNLVRHKENAHKREIYTCNYCDHHTKNMKVLHGHYINVHMKEPPDYLKELMKQGTPKVDEEKMKIRQLTIKKTARNQKKVECQFCGQLICSYYLRTHLNRKHFDKKSFNCHHEGCDYSATTSGNLKNHILRVHFNSTTKSSSKAFEEEPLMDSSLKQYIDSMREILVNIDKGEMLEQENCLKQCTDCEYKTLSIQAMRQHQESECPILGSYQSTGSFTDLNDSPKQLIIKQEEHMTSTPMQSTTHISKGFMNLISSMKKPGKDSGASTAVMNEPPSYNEAVGKRATAAVWSENPVVLIDGDNIIIKQKNIGLKDRVDVENSSKLEEDSQFTGEQQYVRYSLQSKNYENENDMVSVALKQSSIDSGKESEDSLIKGSSKVKRNEYSNASNSAKINNIKSLSSSDKHVSSGKNTFSDESEITDTDDIITYVSDDKDKGITQTPQFVIDDIITYVNDDKDKGIAQTPQFVIDKINDETTLITVQEGDVQTSYEIRGNLNVGPNGELPSDLYNFIAEMLEKQSIEGQSEEVVYCDIVVND